MTEYVVNQIVAWAALVNLPLLVWITRMLWGMEKRLTIIELKVQHIEKEMTK